MNWENIDDNPDEEAKFNEVGLDPTEHATLKEIEEKTLTQLYKYQDPEQNSNRQALIQLISNFGDLLIQNNVEEIAGRFLTEDFEVFLLGSIGREALLSASGRDGFIELFKRIKVHKRHVRQVFVDVEKNVAFNICEYTIRYENDEEESIIEEVAFEVFTIRDQQKISKYRVFFGQRLPSHGEGDLFALTRREQIRNKVRIINNALAGPEPDLHKVASMLYEHTEFKFWSWENQKCHVFHKNDLERTFRHLELNYRIKYIVPYEILTDTDYAVSNYAYHLEKEDDPTGQKYIFLCNCCFAFDASLNILKMNQQGQLFPENKANIPFESYPKERILKQIYQTTADYKPNLDFFYHSSTNFSCDICQFGPPEFPNTGRHEGLKHYNKMLFAKIIEEVKLDWIKVVDVFTDLHDKSYDTAITLGCCQGTINKPEYKYNGKVINFLSLCHWGFDNGRLAKITQFLVPVPETVPSPFDDENFEALYVRKREKMSE